MSECLNLTLNLVPGKDRELAQELQAKCLPAEWELVVAVALQVVLLEEGRRQGLEYWFHPRPRV